MISKCLQTRHSLEYQLASTFTHFEVIVSTNKQTKRFCWKRPPRSSMLRRWKNFFVVTCSQAPLVVLSLWWSHSSKNLAYKKLWRWRYWLHRMSEVLKLCGSKSITAAAQHTSVSRIAARARPSLNPTSGVLWCRYDPVSIIIELRRGDLVKSGALRRTFIL